MKHYVYLAGPIQGLTYDQATTWREETARRLNSDRVECLDPLRGKYHLKGSTSLKADGYSQPMSTNKGIMGRDHFDCCRADVLLVNVLGATKGSLGTAMEVAWAYDRHIPVVLVMEKDGKIFDHVGDYNYEERDNPHQHAMFLEAATYIVPTLEEAERLIRVLLNEPGAEAEVEIKKPSHSMIIKALDTTGGGTIGGPPPLPKYPKCPPTGKATTVTLPWRPSDDGEPG